MNGEGKILKTSPVPKHCRTNKSRQLPHVTQLRMMSDDEVNSSDSVPFNLLILFVGGFCGDQ
jgi:hypothetical protein